MLSPSQVVSYYLTERGVGRHWEQPAVDGS